MRAIPCHVLRIRTGDETALGTRVPRARCDIIGIEQIAEARIERSVIRRMRNEEKLFEEPCRMRPVPFDWTGIGHGLDYLVLRIERGGPALRLGTHRIVEFDPLRAG